MPRRIECDEMTESESRGSLNERKSMTIARNEVLRMVRRLPARIEVEDLIYHLYVREKLARAEADIAAGRTIPHEEVRKRVAKWRK